MNNWKFAFVYIKLATLTTTICRCSEMKDKKKNTKERERLENDIERHGRSGVIDFNEVVVLHLIK